MKSRVEEPGRNSGVQGRNACRPEKMDMSKKWYVVHTYAGHENKVRANLEKAIQYARMQDRFGEILVATEDFAVMKDRKKTITRRKTFPSYVLVEMELDNDTRGVVTNGTGRRRSTGRRRVRTSRSGSGIR